MSLLSAFYKEIKSHCFQKLILFHSIFFISPSVCCHLHYNSVFVLFPRKVASVWYAIWCLQLKWSNIYIYVWHITVCYFKTHTNLIIMKVKKENNQIVMDTKLQILLTVLLFYLINLERVTWTNCYWSFCRYLLSLI